MKRKFLTLALAALTIGLLGSCKKEDPKVSVTGVTLDKTELTLTVGDSDVKLAATVLPENATDKTVSWSSDKTEFATVDNQGNVHAMAPGTANITVTTTDGGKIATCAVTVKAAKVPVTGVTLDKTTLEITVGDPDVKLAATVLPENATDKTVSWASDKTEFATVDNQGKVHAVAPGTANITVTTTDGNKIATCAVTVKAALPEGALSGEFSVSATKKVYFSKGNLVATIDAPGAPTAWKFAANQYDCLGEGGANKTIGATAGDVDFFGWSTSTNGGTSTTDNYGIKTSTTTSDYSEDFYDWGKAVGDGNTWRTLSKDEWTYLFNNHSKKWATVNGVKGWVIAPDGFDGTLSSTYADDAALAANNLVFLPAAGYRLGSNVLLVGQVGLYWSSTAIDGDSAYIVYFDNDGVYSGDTDSRYNGYSVRLVTEVK